MLEQWAGGGVEGELGVLMIALSVASMNASMIGAGFPSR